MSFFIDTTPRREDHDAAVRLVEAEEPALLLGFSLHKFEGETGQHGSVSSALSEATFKSAAQLEEFCSEIETITLPWLRACAAAWRTIETR